MNKNYILMSNRPLPTLLMLTIIIFKPIIDNSLDEVGAIQLYDKMLKKYRSKPFLPNLKADLSQHVIDEGMSGMFYYLAKEEAAIRKDPLKQTTGLLKKVFSN